MEAKGAKRELYLKAAEDMHAAAQRGDWDSALVHANAAIRGFNDPHRELPQYVIPPEALDKVLKEVRPWNRDDFMFEISRHMHPGYSHDQLMKLWSLSEHDQNVDQAITSHPNWNPTEQQKNEMGASEFWRSYERSTSPHHFAAVKSLFSGKDEDLIDHRGRPGTSEVYQERIPHLNAHAKKVQDAVLKDESIEKKYFKGRPYIKLYRGVAADYGKKVTEAAGMDHESHSIEDRTLNLPISHMASWTTDPEMADRFALGRGDITGQAQGFGVVMSAWHPVDSILHSGYHKVHPGQKHEHPSESEIIVGHPTGKIKVKTKHMLFQLPRGGMAKPNEIRPKPFRKSDIFDFMGSHEFLFKALKEIDAFDIEIYVDEDGLMKAFREPKFIGEIHPMDPTLVGRHHPVSKKIAWHTIPTLARKTDQDILDETPGFLKKLSPEHRRILNKAIDSVSSSSTRHFRIGWDKSPEKQVLRARHIKSLLRGQESAKLDLSDPSRVVVTMDRHRGLPGETTRWVLTEQGGHDNGEAGIEFLRRNQEAVQRGGLESIAGVYDWQRSMGDVAGRIRSVDSKLRGAGNNQDSSRIYGSSESSQHQTPLIKSPVDTDPSEVKSISEEGSYSFNDNHDSYVTSNAIKGGLFHHVFQDKKRPDSFVHVISNSSNHKDPTLATLEGDLDGKALNVARAYVSPEHAGKDYGKMAYAAALMHHGALRSDHQTSPNANRAWRHMKENVPGINVRLGSKNYSSRHSAVVVGDGSDLREHIGAEALQKFDGLNKALSMDELHGLGYKFKVLPPSKKREAYAITVHHKGKRVGHVAYSKNPRLGSRPENSHQKGFHEVWSAHVDEEHRGKGLYQAMLNAGAEHVKTLGSKGLMSEGYQRSGDATHAWDKTATFAVDPSSSTSIKKLPYRADYFIQKNEEGQKTRLVHYSHIPDLTRLDPAFYGTGHRGAEHKRSPGPRTFYYLEGTKPEDVVTQKAPYRYVAELPEGHKIYDVGSDPHGVVARAAERTKSRQINPGVLTPEDIEDAVKEAGYHGLYNSSHPNIPNAVSYFHPLEAKREEEPMGKSFFEDLEKVGEGYKKLMASGIALLHPVRMGNKTISNDGVPFHTTIKVFHPQDDRFQQAHDIARSLNLLPPDPAKTTIKPMIFKDRFGDDVHVLELGGDAERVIDHNAAFERMGFPAKFKFKPHITIDQDTYNKVVQEKPQTAADMGIVFGEAELRSGHEVVRKYPPKV